MFSQSRADSRWIGEYSGASGGKTRFYASYADNASGHSHIAVHRVAIPFP